MSKFKSKSNSHYRKWYDIINFYYKNFLLDFLKSRFNLNLFYNDNEDLSIIITLYHIHCNQGKIISILFVIFKKQIYRYFTNIFKDFCDDISNYNFQYNYFFTFGIISIFIDLNMISVKNDLIYLSD